MWPEQFPSGSYTWSQFVRYVVYCTNQQGSALYDQTLGDQDIIDQMYAEAVADQGQKIVKRQAVEEEPSQPRRGYSREAELLTDLNDNIIALRAEMGEWKSSSVKFTPRPKFPADVVAQRMRNRARQRRDAAINAAQARWRELNA